MSVIKILLTNRKHTALKKILSFTPLLAGIIIMLSGCEKLELAVDVPSCVERKIKEIKKDNVSNPPAQVWKWVADGSTYFYITADCCDQYNYLYDDSCNIVCAPDGGIKGTGDGNCPDFKGEIEKTLIWKDDRN